VIGFIDLTNNIIVANITLIVLVKHVEVFVFSPKVSLSKCPVLYAILLIIINCVTQRSIIVLP
jgi:hypothetical protein